MGHNKRKLEKQINNCNKKIKMTKIKSIIVCKQLQKKGIYVRSYKCPICKHYHVTHMDKKLRAFDRAFGRGFGDVNTTKD